MAFAERLHENRTQAEPQWSPYDNNGGSCCALAGEDFAVVAVSTRLSTGLSILCRDNTCLTKMSDRCVVLSSGFQADIKAVHKYLQTRGVMYQHEHNKPMSCTAMAQLTSNTLYYRRFFPYYTFSICAGLDPQGKGCVFGYDAVGNKERVEQVCQGTGTSLIQPLFDVQYKSRNRLLHPPREQPLEMTVEEAVDLVKDAFVTAGERDIYTGDAVEIWVMTRDGVKTERMELKKD